MIRSALTLFPLISLLFFPFGISLVAVVIAAFLSPFIPLAAGIFAEVLYGAPQAYGMPVYLVSGAIFSAFAFLVHRFVETSIIKG